MRRISLPSLISVFWSFRVRILWIWVAYQIRKKNLFQFSAGLNLETLGTILIETTIFKPRLNFFTFGLRMFRHSEGLKQLSLSFFRLKLCLQSFCYLGSVCYCLAGQGVCPEGTQELQVVHLFIFIPYTLSNF